MAKGTAVVNKKKVRIDKYRVRLRAGEYQLDNGRYVYRWRESDGKRPAVYADNLQELREKEEQISADKHDKIRTNVKSITINDMFDLWRKLKRGIKDSTLKNYIYMYETFVKPNFGKSRITEVRKSDVRGFYNNLIDGKTMKMSTVDVIHNILHQVFQVAVDDDMIRGNPTDGMLRELKLSHLSNSQKKEALTEVGHTPSCLKKLDSNNLLLFSIM